MGNSLASKSIFLDNNTAFGKTINEILESIPEHQARACCLGVVGADGPFVPIRLPAITTKADRAKKVAWLRSESTDTSFGDDVKVKIINGQAVLDKPEEAYLDYVKIGIKFQGKDKDAVCKMKNPYKQNNNDIMDYGGASNQNPCDEFYKRFCSNRMSNQGCFLGMPKSAKFDDKNKRCLPNDGRETLGWIEDDCRCINSAIGYTLNTLNPSETPGSRNIYRVPPDQQFPQMFDQACFQPGHTTDGKGPAYKLKEYTLGNITLCLNQINIVDSSIENANLKQIEQKNECGAKASSKTPGANSGDSNSIGAGDAAAANMAGKNPNPSKDLGSTPPPKIEVDNSEVKKPAPMAPGSSAMAPPKKDPPKEDPPKEDPPKKDPPKKDPPKEDPPKKDPPKKDPPKKGTPKKQPQQPQSGLSQTQLLGIAALIIVIILLMFIL